MAEYLTGAQDALRTAVLTVWPEVQLDGIFEAEHLEEVPFEHLAVPYVSVLYGKLEEDDDWGLANQAYIGKVQIYYVAESDGGDSDLFRGKLEDLRDALLAENSLTSGQVLDVTGLDWSDSMEPNATFADKNYPQRAGVLTVEILVGEYVV